MWAKTLLLVLSLFFFCVVPSFSDVYLTDGDYQTIVDKLVESDQTLAQSQADLAQYQADLAMYQDKLGKVELRLETLSQSLKMRDALEIGMGASLLAILSYTLLVHFKALPP